MSTRKAELQEIVAAAYQARDELQAIEDAERNAKNAALLNACQKVRNSYGSGDDWWLYRRVLALKGTWCTSFRFEVRTDSGIYAQVMDMDSVNADRWESITEQEFQAAYGDLLWALSDGYTKRAEEGKEPAK